MKSYNHLYEQFISDENIELAIKNAQKGKKNRKIVKEQLADPDFKDHIRYYAEHFKNHEHRPKLINDGIKQKKRTIIVPHFDEQVIHHMVVNVLKPIFLKSMYVHSYGSIPNKGGYKGKRAIEKFIRNNPKECKYILKMDIKKYFESIPHDIYLKKLKTLIHDEKFFSIIREITEVIPDGLPLGFYTSQWAANWYLTGLDHYIKEELHAPFYIRYMDDMVIFCGNKRRLHQMKDSISKYLETLGLELKDNWQIFRFDYKGRYRFLDFMGFRFYRGRTTLRRSIMLRITRKARRIYKARRITVYASRQMLSYLGWIRHTDTYGMYLAWIKPILCFQKLKRRIKAYDRNQNRRVKNELGQNRKCSNAA